MIVEIQVSLRREDDEGSRSVIYWCGELNWPNVQRDMYWCHCGGWAAERIHAVFLNGPRKISANDDDLGLFPDADVSLEVKTNAQVIYHLRSEHGFLTWQQANERREEEQARQRNANRS